MLFRKIITLAAVLALSSSLQAREVKVHMDKASASFPAPDKMKMCNLEVEFDTVVPVLGISMVQTIAFDVDWIFAGDSLMLKPILSTARRHEESCEKEAFRCDPRDKACLGELLFAPCDFNQDTVVDQFEKQYCRCDFDGNHAIDSKEVEACKNGTTSTPTDVFAPCDANKDGIVDKTEKAQCEKPAELLPCDTNKDGKVDEVEQKQCSNPPPLPCDTDKDGKVDDMEKRQCGNTENPVKPLPCDTNKDGKVDDVEKRQCGNTENPVEPLPCDTDKDGKVDEVEQKQCSNPPSLPCDTNKDGKVDDVEQKQCAEGTEKPKPESEH